MIVKNVWPLIFVDVLSHLTMEQPGFAALSVLSDIWLEPYRPIERNRIIFHNLICKPLSIKLYFKELFI